MDEGEGAPHICGAHARLHWRCTQCAALRAGFAFAYGRCPKCGGKLEALDTWRGDQAAALDGIRMAFEIELGGRAFYQRAAADSADPTLRALFGRFALMEGEHMETLARRYHLDIPEPTPEFRIELAAVFADVPSRPRDPDNLFRIAIALERRAAAFFAERAGFAAAGSAEQRLFRELAEEEAEHAQTLQHEFERWRSGPPGRFSQDASARADDAASAAAPPLNAAALLLAGLDGHAPAVCCGERTLTRAELRDQVARCAALWQARGIGQGERIAIRLNDSIDWVVAFLGAMWAGAVAVAVNPRIPEAEWRYVLDEAGFSLILAASADETPPPWRARVLLLPEWRQQLARALPVDARAMPSDAPALWCHSSGTSGKPKAVVHGHRFARQIEVVSRDGLGLTASDRLYASSKLFFAYPQTNALFAALKLGACLIVDEQWPTAAGVAGVVAAQHPTVLFSVPSLYRSLLHEGLAQGIAASGVRLCVSAGETLPASLRAAWQRQTGLPIVSGYGASETMVLAMLDVGDGRDFQPSPGVQVQAVGATASALPTRLLIRAPTLALGYLDRPQAQAECFRDGGFCAADLFVANDAGGWRFAGREDSLVKIGGRWVNLVELEEQLGANAPGVIELAAVCVADADGIDAVAVFYVASDREMAAAALRERADALPHHQRPRWLHAVDSLPRTATGKLVRRRLQELQRVLA
jgi:acyl-coenzyme A synthetase/AMP-(fatty) acid ligase/rubrerythrin